MPTKVASLPDIDPEVIELCNALNARRGVSTVESCSGHGTERLKVFFTATRQSVVAEIAEAIHVRESGIRGWQIRVFGRTGQGKRRRMCYVLEAPPHLAGDASEIARLVRAQKART